MKKRLCHLDTVAHECCSLAAEQLSRSRPGPQSCQRGAARTEVHSYTNLLCIAEGGAADRGALPSQSVCPVAGLSSKKTPIKRNMRPNQALQAEVKDKSSCCNSSEESAAPSYGNQQDHAKEGEPQCSCWK